MESIPSVIIELIREDCFSVFLLWAKTTIYIRKKGKLNSSTSCFADVNDCATGKHNCNGSSICHNTKGSFRCICREPGYFWNGVNCTGKYLLYIEIVDSSDKKGRCVIGVCHMMKSLSLSLSLISRLFPLFRVQLFKNKQTNKRERFVEFVRFQFV